MPDPEQSFVELRVARACAPRPSRAVRASVLALAAAGVLAACGGGGGDTAPSLIVAAPPAPAAPVAGRDFPLIATTTVDAPTYDTSTLQGQARAAAFQRLNDIRSAAGLGLLRQNAALDRASQGHSEWMVTNRVYDHVQTPGTPGFTAVRSWDRARVAGYQAATDWRAVNEVLAQGPMSATGAQWAVDFLTNMIYHRFAILDPSYLDVGVGWQARTGSATQLGFLTMNPARPAAAPAGQDVRAETANANGIVAWPIDGAVDVQIDNGAELPPPPGGGLAASLHCHQRSTLRTTSFTMRVATTGQQLQTTLLDRANDPAGLLSLTPCFAAAVPKDFLPENTRIQVDFVGQLVRDGVATPVTRQWFFTTSTRRASDNECQRGPNRLPC